MSTMRMVSTIHENDLPVILSHSYEVDVVVGKIVGNGFSIQFSSDKNFTGITMCIPLPLAQDVDWTLRSGISQSSSSSSHARFIWMGHCYLRGARIQVHPTRVAYSSFGPSVCVAPSSPYFTYLLVHFLTCSRACFELLSESDLVYFPIGLVKDYTEATIYNTWDSDEKGLIIFCIIAYLIVLIWATANLIWRLKQEKLKILPPNSELALFSIIVLSSRTSFFYHQSPLV